MRSLYRLVVPLRAILQKRQVEQDLDEELRFHLEMEIAQNIRRGMSPRHARTVALRNFWSLDEMTPVVRAVVRRIDPAPAGRQFPRARTGAR